MISKTTRRQALRCNGEQHRFHLDGEVCGADLHQSPRQQVRLHAPQLLHCLPTFPYRKHTVELPLTRTRHQVSGGVDVDHDGPCTRSNYTKVQEKTSLRPSVHERFPHAGEPSPGTSDRQHRSTTRRLAASQAQAPRTTREILT